MSHSFSPSIESPNNLPTVGQLERRLSQALQSSYAQWTGQSPSHVMCHIVDRVINILIQDSITPLESLLKESQASFVRKGVNEKIRGLIPDFVKGICGVATESIMLDSNADSGLTGIIILLAANPEVRIRKRKS